MIKKSEAIEIIRYNLKKYPKDVLTTDSVMSLMEVILNELDVVWAPEVKVLKSEQIAVIIDDVCEATGIDKAEIYGSSRRREVVNARYFIIYLIKERFGNDISLKRIGEFIGGRDHTTVLHAFNTFVDRVKVKDAQTQSIMIQYHQYVKSKEITA